MRANVTVVVDLPVDVDEFITDLKKMTDTLVDPKVWDASFQAGGDQRDPQPAHISLTIGGQTKESTP